MKSTVLTQVFAFLSTSATFLGQQIVGLLHRGFPSVSSVGTLTEPVGYLALLTLFFILVTTLRKVALYIVIAGWVLLFVRFLLMAFRIG